MSGPLLVPVASGGEEYVRIIRRRLSRPRWSGPRMLVDFALLLSPCSPGRSGPLLLAAKDKDILQPGRRRSSPGTRRRRSRRSPSSPGSRNADFDGDPDAFAAEADEMPRDFKDLAIIDPPAPERIDPRPRRRPRSSRGGGRPIVWTRRGGQGPRGASSAPSTTRSSPPRRRTASTRGSRRTATSTPATRRRSASTSRRSGTLR